jgi:hypothetical protein
MQSGDPKSIPVVASTYLFELTLESPALRQSETRQNRGDLPGHKRIRRSQLALNPAFTSSSRPALRLTGRNKTARF